jgi:hypothetical protein
MSLIEHLLIPAIWKKQPEPKKELPITPLTKEPEEKQPG